MPNASYQKGTRFELKVKKWLEARGFTVCRSAGSKGLVDLIATNHTKCWHIQCKMNRPGNPVNLICEIGKNLPMNCTVAIFFQTERGNVAFESLGVPLL